MPAEIWEPQIAAFQSIGADLEVGPPLSLCRKAARRGGFPIRQSLS
jgi:hypothetical protein